MTKTDCSYCAMLIFIYSLAVSYGVCRVLRERAGALVVVQRRYYVSLIYRSHSLSKINDLMRATTEGHTKKNQIIVNRAREHQATTANLVFSGKVSIFYSRSKVKLS